MSKPVLALFAALLLTALVYSIGLHGPFVFDDAENLAPINRWLNGEIGWLRVVFDNTSGRFGRPVSMASFVLNVQLLGPEVWALKLGNLLIHLLNGALVYALFTALLRRGTLLRDGDALPALRWLPALGAALWLLHPLLVSTVLYVVQRMAMLSALFTLLAMLAYLYGRVALIDGRNRRAWALLLLAVPLCTVLAVLSKENGVLAPALCALIELFAFAPRAGQRRPWASKLFILVTLVLPALVGVVLTLVQHPAVMVGYDNRPFTLGERVLTQGRVLWSYLGALLLPFGPRLGLYHDDYAVSHGLLEPATTLFALLAWAAMVAAAWRLRRAIPGFALGLGIFLVGQALESSVFSLLMYFEHRNYLPAVGAIWMLLSLGAYAAMRLQPHLDNGRRVFAFAAVALVLVLAAATAARAGVWQTKRALLVQGVAYHPQSRWVRVELAQEAMQRSPPDTITARHNIDALLASDEPSTQRLAGIWQLLIDCGSGQPAQQASIALAFGGEARAFEPDLVMPMDSLADGVKSQPCRNLDARKMAIALASMLDRATIPGTNVYMRRMRFKAAQLYLASGDPAAALAQARTGYSGQLADAPIGAFIVGLEIQRGDLVAAQRLLDRLKAQVPHDEHQGMGFLDGLQQQLDEAKQGVQASD